MSLISIIKSVKLYFIILLICTLVLLVMCAKKNVYEPILPTTTFNKNVDTIIMPKINFVFILYDKNIDYNKMVLKEITEKILEDSIVQIRAKSPEFTQEPQVIKVYHIGNITCNFLKNKFKDKDPGELVYEYDNKVLVKLKDGIIKVYHEHHK